ncbi:MAG: sigma-54 dependent transcriptional regulator [Proteobacteria bacterium]|nr:sigma-54 dependent transcriptional regulator [Pseudomonadota bacterium]
MTKFSLLMVDDEPEVLSTLKKTFLDDDYDIYTAFNGREALELMRDVRIDAALIDLNMPGMDGLSLLKEIRKDYPHIMIIMLTGYGGVKEAVKAIKLGAMDFLEKPFLPEGLCARVAQLHQIWGLKEENRNLKARMEFKFGFHQLVGNSTAMLKLKETIAQVGPTDASTVILGETGAGKELVARAIHYHSPRAENNFVPVDCSAISETVMESEIFGHVKGAFTGAHMSTQGLIRSADNGTLFLDEVGELSRSIQAKLLRTIQEKEVRPVGSTKSYQVDIRIIGATNRDLAQEVVQKNFREDLFYRLNVVSINVPPLRGRREDIPLLARYFIKQFSTDVSPVKDVSRKALACLENYDWPGNVRELENAIRRAIALGKGEIILPEDLPANIYIPPGKPSQSIDLPTEGSLAANEKAAVQDALVKSDNNRKKAAQILGISEVTIYRKIKKYHIK